MQVKRRFRFRKMALYGVGLPITFLATAAGVYYGELHLVSRAERLESLPALPTPLRSDRILIVAPHPDDETLGCGGLIQEAQKAGATVTVAVLTNGEGFEQSAVMDRGKLDLGPGDYRDYARVRRGENQRAMEALGLRERIRFLNYPDRGLSDLFRRYWFRTRRTRIGGEGAEDVLPEGPVTGEGLTARLAALIEEVLPTCVYVTHPLDDHADHAMAFAFTQAALLRVSEPPTLRTYLIHRGDWPLPQGYQPSEPLRPQPDFTDPSAMRLNLDETQVRAKKAAIDCYGSQLPLLGRFVLSFVRTNELFFGGPPVRVVPLRGIVFGRPRATWAGLEPLSEEPAGDNLFRQLSPGLDIVKIYAACDSRRLSLRFDFAGRVRQTGEFSLTVRGFDARGRSVGTFNGSLTPSRGHDGFNVYWSRNTLEWALDRGRFRGARTIAVQLETSPTLQGDRSAAIFLRFPD